MIYLLTLRCLHCVVYIALFTLRCLHWVVDDGNFSLSREVHAAFYAFCALASAYFHFQISAVETSAIGRIWLRVVPSI